MTIETLEALQVAVGIEHGKVVMVFPRHVDRIEFDPSNALDICEAVSQAALQLRDPDVPIAGPALKAALAERIKDTLVPRIALMLASTREDKTRSNGALAVTLVETCLREVF